MFRGVYTALVTPFKNGVIDEAALQKHVEWQIEQGVHGIVPVGTTGESPTLSHKEHHRVIQLCVEAANKRVPVVAGSGSNSTTEAIELTQRAHELGADGVLVVVPYYNKPTPEGLYQHFKAVSDASSLPIILYNIPGRSVVNMDDTLIARLAKLPNIVGIKDATGDLARVSTLRAAAGKKFCQLSGEDMTALAFNAAGGQGCISVTSNVAPKLCAEMQNAWFVGNAAKALDVQDRLVMLHKVLFCESNPAPVKYALSLMGRCQPDLRLPLVTLRPESQTLVKEAMKAAGLI